ncbi:rhamnulokinase [Paenibacillus uliginis N3/975]|uniref:Rhamnulokinase n=1 Tax=Paenibacillus uliginis N3/975 TaxID=1313296 RepID=A0A1X7HBF3_9BACL|nr:rhamnulokinase family protein [Paenibacillus uliginis]SMF82797.1 rhamnulokinase [Paenibacillus uliginis N3/975]
MNDTSAVLAFDMGASSGRALIGEIIQQEKGQPGLLKITEIHRFPNTPVQFGNHLHWNIATLFQEVKNGIQKAFQSGYTPESYGMDTWGVDFGLIDRNGELVGIPYHYRDTQTIGMVEKTCAQVGRERLFDESGLAFMPFNTIYQLHAMVEDRSPKLDIADKLLLTPDLLHYFLTGQQVCEFTMATTTQLYHVKDRRWNTQLIEELGLNPSMFIDPVEPGTIIGHLQDFVCKELDVPAIQAVAVASHDTESAVVAVPANSPIFAYLVCGTWSLLGTELSEPLIHPDVLELGFSNEGGAYGTFQLLKNIMGLWILQECKRQWDREGEGYTFGDLVELAEGAQHFRSFIDPDDLRFMNPPDMTTAIQNYCRETEQPVPHSKGDIVRCILESLALRYREVLERMEKLTGNQFSGLHMVGGGIQNELLCQFTANALGRPVWAGPVEASAIGNMLVQFIANGTLKSREEGIELVKKSFPIVSFDPHSTEQWNEAFAKYSGITRGLRSG